MKVADKINKTFFFETVSKALIKYKENIKNK